MATPSSILARISHGERSLVGYSPWGHKESDKHRWQAGSTVVLSHRASGPQHIGVPVAFDAHVPGLHWAHVVHSFLGHSAPWVLCTLIATCFCYRFLRPVISLVRMHFFGHPVLGLQCFWSP